MDWGWCDTLYFVIVTLTTVGYGDVSPATPLGKALAAVLMLVGYSLIIVPTGILAAELGRAGRPVSNRACAECTGDGHEPDAKHCKHCGELPQRCRTTTASALLSRGRRVHRPDSGVR